jgi:hypothetical protein
MVLETDEMTRRRAACRLANDLMLDLVTATQAFRTLQAALAERPAGEPVEIGINRLCLFYVILTLAKWIEFYDRYAAIIPADVREVAKELRNEVERRGIRRFRNNVVGHIWDDEANRALTNAEVEHRLTSITGGDVAAFMNWVNNGGDDPPDAPISVMERVKIRLINEYKLSYDEIDE